MKIEKPQPKRILLVNFALDWKQNDNDDDAVIMLKVGVDPAASKCIEPEAEATCSPIIRQDKVLLKKKKKTIDSRFPFSFFSSL